MTSKSPDPDTATTPSLTCASDAPSIAIPEAQQDAWRAGSNVAIGFNAKGQAPPAADSGDTLIVTGTFPQPPPHVEVDGSRDVLVPADAPPNLAPVTYARFKAAADACDADEEAEIDRLRPGRAARRAIRGGGERQYDLGDGHMVCVDLAFRNVWTRLGGTQINADILGRAAAALRHVEAWIAGQVDVLAPSGPWPAPDGYVVTPSTLSGVPRAWVTELLDELRTLADRMREEGTDGRDAQRNILELVERHMKTWGAPAAPAFDWDHPTLEMVNAVRRYAGRLPVASLEEHERDERDHRKGGG